MTFQTLSDLDNSTAVNTVYDDFPEAIRLPGSKYTSGVVRKIVRAKNPRKCLVHIRQIHASPFNDDYADKEEVKCVQEEIEGLLRFLQEHYDTDIAFDEGGGGHRLQQNVRMMVQASSDKQEVLRASIREKIKQLKLDAKFSPRTAEYYQNGGLAVLSDKGECVRLCGDDSKAYRFGCKVWSTIFNTPPGNRRHLFNTADRLELERDKALVKLAAYYVRHHVFSCTHIVPIVRGAAHKLGPIVESHNKNEPSAQFSLIEIKPTGVYD